MTYTNSELQTILNQCHCFDELVEACRTIKTYTDLDRKTLMNLNFMALDRFMELEE